MLRREHELAIHLIRPTPIQQLPVELLVLIFSFIPNERKGTLNTIAQTCRTWKEIVLSFWGPLKLATWTPLDAVNDRRDGLPSITIDPFNDAMDRPVGSLETDRYAALMLAASTSISRWRTLDILSLPEPQQTNSSVEEQSHMVDTVPMNHLRSLRIPLRHDFSQFLDLLLPSIGSITSDQLTDMHLCSEQAILHLTQPHCVHIFNSLLSFTCLLPRTDNAIDILPHCPQLEILDVSGFRFPTYLADVELPLTKTLRQLSFRGVPISWMNRREFLQLESCTIISPPALDTIITASLPLCAYLHFEGPRFDTIGRLRVPAIRTLILRSPQWSKSRGNIQLSHLWGAAPRKVVFRPTSLHLQLTCSSELLLWALCSMPELKELLLELDHSTALGRRFFIGFLPPNSRVTWPYQWAGECMQACPSLEVLGLKYQRWFRPGELNEMPALVALAQLNERDHKLRIWVEKGPASEERIQVECAEISASVLCSLGLLQPSNGGQHPSWVIKECVKASLATLYPTGIKFYHSETMLHLSPSVHSCLFQQLRDFALHADIDQRVLFEALAQFEHLEQLHVKRLGDSSSQPRLPLLRTLKRLQLGMTSLLWMEGCTFIKLEDLRIGGIDGGNQVQCVQMPVCKSASFPQSISSHTLSAFKMPQLHNLDLHNQQVGLARGFHYPSTQQFRLCTASYHFGDLVALRYALAMQPELEVLEIRGLLFPCELGTGLSGLLGMLLEPNPMNSLDSLNPATAPPRKDLLLCPRLKQLKLKLDLNLEWKQKEIWKELLVYLALVALVGLGLLLLLRQLRGKQSPLTDMMLPSVVVLVVLLEYLGMGLGGQWQGQGLVLTLVLVLELGWKLGLQLLVLVMMLQGQEHNIVFGLVLELMLLVGLGSGMVGLGIGLVVIVVLALTMKQELKEWRLGLKLKQEHELIFMGGEYWRTLVHQCQEFRRRRTEKGCQLQCCQLAWHVYQMERTYQV